MNSAQYRPSGLIRDGGPADRSSTAPARQVEVPAAAPRHSLCPQTALGEAIVSQADEK